MLSFPTAQYHVPDWSVLSALLHNSVFCAQIEKFVAARFRKLRSLDLSNSVEATRYASSDADIDLGALMALSSLQAVRWGCAHRDRALLPAPSPCYQFAANLPALQNLTSLELPGALSVRK